jgi:hypothetical protein
MQIIKTIRFNPQDVDDTLNAISEAVNNDDKCELIPDVNLISLECLGTLSAYGFNFTKDLLGIRKFVK